MANSATMKLLTPEGESVDWKTFSSRIDQFRADYPAASGYGIKREVKSLLDFSPGLMGIYERVMSLEPQRVEAMIEAMGIPKVSELLRTFVFTCSLVKDGEVLEMATAARQVNQLNFNSRGWEKAESAAESRMLAMLGIGGEVLDKDAAEDMADAGFKLPENPGGQEPAKPVAELRQPTASKSKRPKAPSNEQKLNLLNRQVKAKEAARGIESTGPYSTVDAAMARLKELTHRGGTGSRPAEANQAPAGDSSPEAESPEMSGSSDSARQKEDKPEAKVEATEAKGDEKETESTSEA